MGAQGTEPGAMAVANKAVAPADDAASSPRRRRLVRLLVLFVLAVQNCSLMMVASYSRTLPGPKYLTSTAVFAGEVVKTVVVLGVLCVRHGAKQAREVVRQDVFSANSQTFRYAVPSIFYTLQNNLWYFAMSNLDSVSAAVSSQTKIMSTAAFSILLLGKQLNHMHWSGLCLLMLGLVVMKAGPGDDEHDSWDLKYNLGLLAMVAACTSSGFAGVYLERLFKQLNPNVWTANLQLQLFCLPVAAMALLSDWEGISSRGILSGWNSVTCLVVLLNALGGFIVSLTMKYADNILKTFAVSISLVANCLLSSVFQEVELSSQAMTGVAFVIIATGLYGMANSYGNMEKGPAAPPGGWMRVDAQPPEKDIESGPTVVAARPRVSTNSQDGELDRLRADS